jgi:hypothetical protein
LYSSARPSAWAPVIAITKAVTTCHWTGIRTLLSCKTVFFSQLLPYFLYRALLLMMLSLSV